MSSPGLVRTSILFGPFEFDARSGELRKRGIRLRLHGQPLQILLLLLERPGEIITREELKRRLWNGTTFVDFEHGLNAAVNRLRQTLGDSADSTRYIETLAGRGYRFIAAVESPAPKSVAVTPPPAPSATLPHSAVVPVWKSFGIGLAVALLAAVSAYLLGARARTAPNSEQIRFQIAVPEWLTLSDSQSFSLAPDGTALVFLARRNSELPRLWAQTLNDFEPYPLPGTEIAGGDPPVFWSPDSRFVAYYTAETLRKVDLKGSQPQVICRVPSIVLGGAWAPDDTILFGTETSGIMRVPASGGVPRALTGRDAALGERVHGWPSLFPDGRRFIYSRLSSVAANNRVVVRAIDSKPADMDLATLTHSTIGTQLVPNSTGGRSLLFMRDAALWVQDLDETKLALIGESRRVVNQLGNNRAFGFFSASLNGRIIYREAPMEMSQLAWWDRRGRQTDAVGEPSQFDDAFAPVISPDGEHFATSQYERGEFDLWVRDLGRGVAQRITFDPAIDVAPVWSHDGKDLYFASGRSGHYDLFRIHAGGGEEQPLFASNQNKYPVSASPDGRFLLFRSRTGQGSADIWALPLDKHGTEPFRVVATSADESEASLSPDGRWMAFVSDQSGRGEVYLQEVTPSLSVTGPKTLLSRDGGQTPRWRRDGKEVFYASSRKLMSVALAGNAVRLGIPRILFPLPAVRWDVTGNGTRFLVEVPRVRTKPPFVAVLNWQIH